jgi:hypothetical protein
MQNNLPLKQLAREIGAVHDGTATEAGRFSLSSSKQDCSLQRDVAELARTRNGDLRRLEIRRPSHRRPYRLLIVPVPDSGVLPLGVAQPSVAVVIIDSEAGPDPDPAILRDIFSLTPAEARLAAKLVKGQSLEEIAEKPALPSKLYAPTSSESLRRRRRSAKAS